jgi:arginyl-tRNA--protein-N-Asp/Glu arginylyltransferase
MEIPPSTSLRVANTHGHLQSCLTIFQTSQAKGQWNRKQPLFKTTTSWTGFLKRQAPWTVSDESYTKTSEIFVVNQQYVHSLHSKYGYDKKTINTYEIRIRVIRVILVNDQLEALFLNVFISCLYMFRATSAHHQEDQLVSIRVHHLV